MSSVSTSRLQASRLKAKWKGTIRAFGSSERPTRSPNSSGKYQSGVHSLAPVSFRNYAAVLFSNTYISIFFCKYIFYLIFDCKKSFLKLIFFFNLSQSLGDCIFSQTFAIALVSSCFFGILDSKNLKLGKISLVKEYQVFGPQ